MRDILNQMKERRASPRPLTPVQLRAMADLNRIGQQIEAQNSAQILFMMNVLQSGRSSEPIDVEAMKTLLTYGAKNKLRADTWQSPQITTALKHNLGVGKGRYILVE